MAGFFGLFDYSKPGPGVHKNGPKKKSFVVFFEIFFRKFWKLITVNLLYVLVSLPVLTVGLANAGISYVTRNYAREKHAFIAGDFFETIKKNWKQALPVGIINLLVSIILAFDLWFFYGSADGVFGYIMLAIIMSLTLIFTFMKYYLYFMMVTFKLSIKQLYKNSIIFAFVGMGRNFLLFIIMALLYALGAMILFLSLPIGIAVLVFMYIFLFPAFRMLLVQFTVFPLIKKHMIDPYYKEHPGEDKEAKQALNLLDEDDYDVERVFDDTVPTDDEQNNTTIPRQYTKEEMSRLRRLKNRAREQNDEDDDGTI